MRMYTHGELVNDLKADIEINRPIDDSMFDIPGHFHETVSGFAEGPRIVELAEHVFLASVNPSYNILFVEFDSYVLSVDAPRTSALTDSGIALLRQRIPDKPIKYAGMTHHHWDHCGGVRAFVAEGAQIITTSGNVAFFQKVMTEHRTLARDAISDEPREAEFSLVTDKLLLSEGKQSVEVYSVGPTPHVDEMLIYFLPQQKMLFTADHLAQATPAFGVVQPASPGTVFMAEKIKELGLDVQTLITAHGGVGSIKNLEVSLLLRKQRDKGDVYQKGVSGTPMRPSLPHLVPRGTTPP